MEADTINGLKKKIQSLLSGISDLREEKQAQRNNCNSIQRRKSSRDTDKEGTCFAGRNQENVEMVII